MKRTFTKLQRSYETRDGHTLVPYPNADEYWTRRNGIDVLALFVEALRTGKISLPTTIEPGSKIVLQIDMGRPLAPVTLVETEPIGLDEVSYFAKRPGHDGVSRVVEATGDLPRDNTIVVVLRQRFKWQDGRRVYLPNTWQILTCYIGTMAPEEPWKHPPGSQERQVALEFWCKHALIHNPKEHGSMRSMTWKWVLDEFDEQ